MRNLALCFLLATLLVITGCGSSGPKPIAVVVTPSGAQALDIGQSFNITVSVSNDPLSKGVTITLSGVGTLSNQSATGATYTAPTTGAGGSATVTVASVADPTKLQTVTIVVTVPPTITTTSLAAAVVGTPYSQSIAETGGAGTLTYSVTVGSLPAGLNLSSSTGAITGTPTGPAGTVNFTVQVKDASTVSPQTATKALSILVNQPPAITSTNNTPFTAGVAGTFTVTSTGSPTPSLTETGALPAGVTFVDNGNGTATLSGTAAGTGTYPFTITASNGVGSNATQNFTLTIGQSAAITSGNSATFTVGAAGTFTVATTGFPAPSLTETGALPAGVTLVDNHNGTATLAGTPAAGTGGTYSFSIKAHNGIGTDATQTFALTVNQGPAITSAASAPFWLGNFTSFTVTTTGLPLPALTETGALPNGVTFVDNHNGTATLAGTPASGTFGNYPLTLKATNSVSAATQSFTLSVVTPAGITSANNTTFTVGAAPGTFTVTALGYPNVTLTETGALPSGVTFTDNGNDTATLTGSPAAGTGGPHSLTITAHNGIGSDYIQPFTLNVNEAPAITSANHATFTAGAAGTFTVTTTGTPLPALTETGALPGNVTFTDHGDGTATLAGTPSASGTFTLTLKATNVVSSTNQTFTLTVDNAPVITSVNNAFFLVGGGCTFTVTTTGSPAPSITETGTLPNGCIFTDNGNGTASLSGTLASGTAGTYHLSIKAHNGIGTDATQAFTLTVDLPPAILSANNTTFPIGTLGTFAVTATGYPYVTFTETGALPTGVTFVDNGNDTATLSGTPAAGTGGTYPLTLTANNGVGTAATQSFTLTVTVPPLTLPSPNPSSLGPATLNQAYSGSINVSGGSPGYTWTANGTPVPTNGTPVSLPDGLTASNNGGSTLTIGGTPTSATIVSFPVLVKDSTNASAGPFTYTITVNNPTPLSLPTPNPTSLGPATTNLLYSGAINASGGVAPFTFAVNGTAVPTSGSAVGLADGLNVTNTGGNTLSVGGTPTAAQTVSFTVTVKDTTGSTAGPFTYTITVSNPTPLTLPSPNPSSLGPATTNQAYSGAINASGGIGPYSWFVNSTVVPTDGTGVALLDGLYVTNTGGNTLSVGGTPTTAQTVTLGVSVKDSTNTTVGQTYTITVSNPTPLSLPSASQAKLGGALVGYAYSEWINASGGVSPYSWTVNSTAIPSTGSPVTISDGITVSSTGGSSLQIGGTPTTAQTVNLVVSVTDSASGSAGPVTYPITVTSGPNGAHNSYLSGTYSCLLEGFSDSDGSRWASVVSIMANGGGSLTSGVFDTNSRDFTTSMSGTLTGTFSIGSDNNGLMTVTAVPTTGTPNTSRFAVALTNLAGPTALQLRMVEIDDLGASPSGQHGSGNCYHDTSTAFVASTISGSSFAFGMRGESGSGTPKAIVGRFSASSGSISTGYFDSAKGNAAVQSTAFTGSYTAPSGTTGRFTMALTPTVGNSANLAVYIIDASRMFVIQTGGGNGLQAGEVRKQQQATYSATNLNGAFVLHSQGFDFDTNSNVTGYYAQVFQASGDGAGNITLNQIYRDDAAIGAQNGTYTASNGGSNPVTFDSTNPGRATVGGGANAYLYLYGTNLAFEMSTGSAEWGMIEAQTLSTFTDAAIAGNYMLGQVPILEPDNGTSVGELNLDSSGNITGSSSNGGPGNFSWESPISANYTWSSTTFGTFLPGSGGGGGLSCVAVSATESVCLENTTSSPDIMIFQQ